MLIWENVRVEEYWFQMFLHSTNYRRVWWWTLVRSQSSIVMSRVTLLSKYSGVRRVAQSVMEGRLDVNECECESA